MALPANGNITLDQIYQEAVAGGYVGQKSLLSLSIWSGWGGDPDGISPHRLSEFYGVSAFGALTTSGAVFEFHQDNNFDNEAVALNPARVLNFYRTSLGLIGRVLGIDTSMGVINSVGPGFTLESGIYSYYSHVLLSATRVVLFYSKYCKVFQVDLVTGSILANQSGLYAYDNISRGWNSSVLLDTNHVINFWEANNFSNGNSRDGSCQIFNIDTNNGIVTPKGNKYKFNNHITTVNSAVKLDNSHVMNFWFDGATSSARCQIFNIDIAGESVIAIGSSHMFDSGTKSNSAVAIDSSHVVLFWDNSGVGYCQIFQVNTSTGNITPLESKYTFANNLSAVASQIDVVKIDNDRVMCVWGREIGYAQIFKVDIVSGEIRLATQSLIFENYPNQSSSIDVAEISCVNFDQNNSMIFWNRLAENRRGLGQLLNHPV